jgi:hypothetical protein
LFSLLVLFLAITKWVLHACRSTRRAQPQSIISYVPRRQARAEREVGAPDTRMRSASARSPNRSAARAIDRWGHRPAPRSHERRAQARRLRSEENPRRRQRQQKGLVSYPVLEGKPNANHVRARISYSRTQQLHNMDIITQCSK